jgi:hypothetical protein
LILERGRPLHCAGRLGVEKLPLAEMRLGRNKAADQGYDDIPDGRAPALAG